MRNHLLQVNADLFFPLPNKYGRCIAALALLGLLAPMAIAQHPSAVMVVFRSHIPRYPGSNQIELDISARIAEICQAKLPHWRYTTGVETSLPQLRVELIVDNGTLRIGMLLAISTTELAKPKYTWKGRVFEPGDDIRDPVLPLPREAPEFLSRVFDRLLSPPNIEALRSRMSDAVPLGTGVVLVPTSSSDRIRGVLPIDWSYHCHEFAESEFIIDCRTETNEGVKLFSVGLSQPFDYPPNQKEFDGVAVQVNSLQKAGDPEPQRFVNPVMKLVPVEFRLKAPKPYYRSCGAAKSLTPNIAP